MDIIKADENETKKNNPIRVVLEDVFIWKNFINRISCNGFKSWFRIVDNESQLIVLSIYHEERMGKWWQLTVSVEIEWRLNRYKGIF